MNSGREGELSELEVAFFLLLSNSFSCALVLGQSSSESSGLLLSEITGGSLLLAVLTSLVSSLLVDHSQDLGNSLSDDLKKDKRLILRKRTYSDSGELGLGSS